MLVNENKLTILPCSIMDIDEPINYTIALELTKIAILKSFEGNPLSVSKLRDKYVTLWDKYWTKEHGKPAEDPTGPYWVGPKASIGIANKIISFLNEYEVISPIQPFNYTLETLVIEGSCCIVRKKVLSKAPRSYLTVVLVEDTSEYIQPDVLALIKWYYVESNYGSTLPNGILYVPLVKGKIKQVFVKNIKLAKTWIIAAFKEQARNAFPIMGKHCKDCKSKRCEEVLNVGQNEDRRIGWLRQISTRR